MLYEPGVGDGFKKSEARQIVVCEEPRQVCDSIQRKKTTEPGGAYYGSLIRYPQFLPRRHCIVQGPQLLVFKANRCGLPSFIPHPIPFVSSRKR